MAQYTSTQTGGNGNVVNAVLDTETNMITFTVTTPKGTVVTNTQSADVAFNSSTGGSLGALSGPILQGGEKAGLTFPLSDAYNDVKAQAAKATIEATATNTPPPAEKQAIPTNNAADPAVPPAAPAPETETPTSQKNADTEQQIEETTYEPLATPPGTDEYDGLETQIAANENGLQEPPDVNPEEDPFEASRLKAEEDYANTRPSTEQDVINSSGYRALSSSLQNTRAQATAQDQSNFTQQEDWRVRLSLSPTANYLYKAKDPGILKPLADTNGVIFPYTPSIQVSYAANYDATDLIHSNYKVYQYKNSSVDSIQLSCDFTAQDTLEANYLLAVIHFFRSVTKMFYGQDNGPKPGTPPPLCFLTGLGAFQFNEHPLAITSFNYSLPTDVDYIRAGQITSLAGVNQQSGIRPMNSYDISDIRLQNIKPGGSPADTVWGSINPLKATVTYVPTKMQIQIGAVPMVSRNDVSNNFSLTDYSSGKLLRGLQNVRGGFW